MKRILIAASLCMAMSAQSAVLRVSNNVNSGAGYTALAEAVSAAAAGDTVMVDGSATSYGDITIERRLVLVGPGYLRSENGVIAEGSHPATIGRLTVSGETAAGWSVIGSINGDWDTDTDMTTEDGVHYTTTIAVGQSGTYEYRVRANHDWTISYGANGLEGGNNFTVAVPEDGLTVTIDFNAETKVVTHTVNVVYSLPGSFNGWSLEANDMMLDEETGLYYATLSLQPGDYEYKVAVNRAWDINYGADGYRDGENIALTITDSSPVTIWFNSITKLTSLNADELLDTWLAQLRTTSEWYSIAEMTTEDRVNYTASFFPVERGYHQVRIIARDNPEKVYPGDYLTLDIEEDNTTLVLHFNAVTGEVYVEQQAPVYSIIGADAAGTGWLGWSSDADMVKGADGTYSVRVDNMAAGEYQYKVRVNHSWDVSYGLNGESDSAGNIPLTVEKDSTDIIFCFDPATKLTTTEVGSEPQPYVVFSDDHATLTFYYGTQRTERGGYKEDVYTSSDGLQRLNGHAGEVTTVVFDESFADYRPTSTSYWFYNCTQLRTFVGIENLHTENVTEMNRMFAVCSALDSLDLRTFDTGKVNYMQTMFGGCHSLRKLNLSNFDTSSLTDMWYMFRGCAALDTLDLSSFNTAKVTMFSELFRDCGNLTTVYVSDKWTVDTPNLSANGSYDVFANCTSIVGGKGTTYDPNHTDAEYARIDGGPDSETPGYFTDKNASDDEPGDDRPEGEATFDGLVATVSGNRTLDEAFATAGGRDEAARTIAAIVWNKDTAPTSDDLQGLDNPNLLLYVQSEAQAPQGVQNVVVGDVCERLVLTDVEGDAPGNFFAPQRFTARRATYTHSYMQQTPIDGCEGWETLTLPFTVQTVTHENGGEIAPFAALDDEGYDERKPFWLYTAAAAEGLSFVRATRVQAYRPYIIAMPNNSSYMPEYLLAGRMTFAAVNAEVQATPRSNAVGTGGYRFLPTTVAVAAADSVWALNIGDDDGYRPGSMFVRNSRPVKPFQCFVAGDGHAGAPQLLPVKDMIDGTTGIDSPVSSSNAEGDKIPGNLYDLGGRRLQLPALRSIHVRNGRKAIVR